MRPEPDYDNDGYPCDELDWYYDLLTQQQEPPDKEPRDSTTNGD